MTDKPKSPESSPWRLFGTGLEFAGAILLLALLGHFADQRWGTEPWGILTGAMVGLTGSMYNLFKLMNRANRQADAANKNTSDTKQDDR